MKKMRGMKGILTPDEEAILKTLRGKFEEIQINGEINKFEDFINGFLTSAKLVAFKMKVLPGQEYLDELEELVKEIAKTTNI